MKKNIWIVLLLFLFAIRCTQSPKNKTLSPIKYQGTKVIAHRGFSGVAPENTLVSFQKAIDIKAEYFELDVHRTKDDQLIVIHDSKVDRTSSNNSSGKVSNMTLEELSKVKVGYTEKYGDAFANEKIPTLKEVLSLAKDKIKVCIEIKEANGSEEAILKVVNDLEMKEQVIIFSFHYQVLAKIRQLDTTIPILYLIDKANKQTIDYAKVIQATAVGVGYATTPTKEYIDFAHSKGIEIWKWTINDPNQMKEMIAVGLDGMITNFPDKALPLRGTLLR